MGSLKDLRIDNSQQEAGALSHQLEGNESCNNLKGPGSKFFPLMHPGENSLAHTLTAAS